MQTKRASLVVIKMLHPPSRGAIWILLQNVESLKYIVNYFFSAAFVINFLYYDFKNPECNFPSVDFSFTFSIFYLFHWVNVRQEKKQRWRSRKQKFRTQKIMKLQQNRIEMKIVQKELYLCVLPIFSILSTTFQFQSHFAFWLYWKLNWKLGLSLPRSKKR